MAGIDRVVCMTVAVRDQEEALHWYVEKLGFEKRADLAGQGMRWLTVSPRKQPDLQIVLASWYADRIGQGLPVIVQTDDCQLTYEELRGRGVEFSQPPQIKPYGVEAVLKDLYGNTYALRQTARAR